MTMKTMISDLKPNQGFKTFLGTRQLTLKKTKNNKEYLMIEFYDITGSIKGYVFNRIEVGEELKKHRYAEVAGLAKIHNGKLILQIDHIRAASGDEFDVNDVFRIPGKEELEMIKAQLWPHSCREPKI